jgi:hypothetical protein
VVRSASGNVTSGPGASDPPADHNSSDRSADDPDVDQHGERHETERDEGSPHEDGISGECDPNRHDAPLRRDDVTLGVMRRYAKSPKSVALFKRRSAEATKPFMALLLMRKRKAPCIDATTRSVHGMLHELRVCAALTVGYPAGAS